MSRVSSQILALKDALAQTKTLDDAWTSFRRELGKIANFEAFYACGGIPEPDISGAANINFMSLHDSFTQAYQDYEFMENDWSAEYCLTAIKPAVMTNDLKSLKRLTPKQKVVEQAYWDFGYVGGMAIPLSNPSQLIYAGCGLSLRNITAKERDDLIFHFGHDLAKLAAFFHSYVLSQHLVAGHFGLSVREKECLTWLAAGLQAKQIAHKLNISTNTVRFHLYNVREKLKVPTLEAAVYKAVVFNVINL